MTDHDDLEARLKEIRSRQAAYSAAHPGRYYLLSDEEMDDIATEKQLATLDRVIEKYKASKRQHPKN